MRVDPDNPHPEPREFVRNTSALPASKMGRSDALGRPIDVKFGPDGKLYILDMGRLEVRGGKDKITAGTGRVFVVEPIVEPETRPVHPSAGSAAATQRVR